MRTEKLTTTVYNLTTGEVVTRDLTEEELLQYQKDKEEYEARKTAKSEFLAAREAVLAKLGLTPEEVKILLA